MLVLSYCFLFFFWFCFWCYFLASRNRYGWLQQVMPGVYWRPVALTVIPLALLGLVSHVSKPSATTATTESAVQLSKSASTWWDPITQCHLGEFRIPKTSKNWLVNVGGFRFFFFSLMLFKGCFIEQFDQDSFCSTALQPPIRWYN